MKAVWNGAVIAESTNTVVVDGNHYFPPESLDRRYVVDSAHTSVCGWKGTANYLSLNVDGKENANAVWYYAEPKSAAAEIRGRMAFWKGVVVQP